MTVPAQKDLAATKGDSLDIFFRVRTRDPATGTLVYRDITGATVRAQVRSQASDPDISLTFTCTLSDQSTTPGGVLVHASPAQTALVVESDSEYDVEVTFSAGDVRTVLAGAIAWRQDITR